jgi:hypothetical protein
MAKRLGQLPYNSEDDGREFLNRIKESAALSIKSGHISDAWCFQLRNFLSLKYKLTLNDRLWFAELAYNIALSGEQFYHSEPFLSLFIDLMKYRILNKKSHENQH